MKRLGLAKLFLLPIVASVILGAGVAGTLVHVSVRDILWKQASATLDQDARHHLARLEDDLHHAGETLHTLAIHVRASLAGHPTSTDAALSRDLGDRVEGDPLLRGLLVVGGEGEVLASSEPSLVGQRLADFWQGGAVAPRYRIGPHSVPEPRPPFQVTTLPLAHPFDLGGRPAALLAFIDWKGLADDVLHVSNGAAGHTHVHVLRNRDGKLLGARGSNLDARQAASLETLHTPAPDPEGLIRFDLEQASLIGRLAHSPTLGWTLLVAEDTTQTAGALRSAHIWIVAGAALVVALVLFLSWMVERRFARVLDTFLPVMRQVVEGDLRSPVPDPPIAELSLLARHFNEMVGSVARGVQTVQGATRRLEDTSYGLGRSAQELTEQVHRTLRRTEGVSAAATEVSSSIDSVATGVEEMSANIREIANTATEAAEVATHTLSRAEETNEAVHTLGASVEAIEQVIEMINAIAEQTNLLALNAAIEAARAGEAGQGFAVVANEVKELAKQTARATETIRPRIEDMQARMQDAVQAIEAITETVRRVSNYQGTISNSVEEQLIISSEMSRSVFRIAERTQEISEGVLEIRQVADTTLRFAQENGEAARRVTQATAELARFVSRFRTRDPGSAESPPSSTLAPTPVVPPPPEGVIPHPALAAAEADPLRRGSA